MNDMPCRLLPDPQFASMGDIRRATEQFRQDPYDYTALEILNSYREFRTCCIETSLGLLGVLGLPERRIVSARLKRMPSIFRKLSRSGVSPDISNIDDIIGFRVILPTLDALNDVVGRASGQSPDVKVKDYLTQKHPNDHGYRGAHVILRFDQPFDETKSFKVRFEVQLRTYLQHQWANWCESMGEQAKEGWPNRRDEPEIAAKVVRLREVSAQIEKWETDNPSSCPKDDLFSNIPQTQGRFALVRVVGDGHKVKEYQSSEEAFDSLRRSEKIGIKSLLLFGVTAEDIEQHFRETHHSFLFGRFPDPVHWLP